MKRRLYCTIPQSLIKEPLLYTLARQFEVIPNIRAASVTEDKAELTLELEGSFEVLDRAVDYMRSQGVEVQDLDAGQSR